MYRNSCYFSKPSILNSRCRFISSKTRNILQNDICILKNGHGRFTSSVSKSNNNNIKSKLYWGLSFATIAVGGASLTVASKKNDEFREAVESAIPFSKFAFSVLIPEKDSTSEVGQELEGDGLTEGSRLTPLHTDSVFETFETVDQINPTEDSERLVVNVMDSPYVSQIDLEVGNQRSTTTMQVEEAEEVPKFSPIEGDDSDRLVVNVMDSPYVSQIDFEVGNSVVEEVIPQEILSQEELDLDNQSVQLDVAEEVTQMKGDGKDKLVIYSPDESQIDFWIGNTDVEEKEAPQVLSQEELEVDLNNSHENLQIILKNAVTSKKLAANLLQSYIIHFGQALLVPKSDTAYEPIWEATTLLEQEVQRNIDLAKAKESEVDNQIKNLQNLISAVQDSGSSDVAIKAEELIVDCHGSLTAVDSEIESASNKRDILLGFKQRVQGSTEKLHEYLEGFTVDLLWLLNSQQYSDVQGVSNEDALLILSLQRAQLLLEEENKKQIQKERQFEAALLLQKADLSRESKENLKNELLLLEISKETELQETIDKLNDLHEDTLHQEIEALSDAHQNVLEYEISTQAATLNARHGEEMERKLNEKEDAHNLVLERNMSYLEGIQSKILGVTDIDHQQRRNQHLWVAAQGLATALESCSENGRTRCLTPELSTILQYGKGDAVLGNIVASLPETAVANGVIPEPDLLQRFKGVKRVCKRVANVEEGGSILSYTLSFIKSFFVISWYYRKNPEEDINIGNIIPYEILEKADYFIQKGDLVQAAKLMSQLKGVSRKMSCDWLNEVRLLLETKQTAKFLTAYAGSLIAGFE